MIEAYLVPLETLNIEEEIKHSRFITRIFHCSGADDFRQQYKQMMAEYPGASHYCYAYVLGKPSCDMTAGSSDDGEPSGSAGRPMLAVLQGSSVGEIAAIVVRYFGGTKLGVGGLVRAYSSGIRKGLLQLVTKTKQLRYSTSLDIDYRSLKDLEYLINKYQGIIVNQNFAEKVKLDFELPKSQLANFNQELATLTQGRLQAKFD